jgi:hypothetical protein
MALAHCILGKFLWVGCHCFPPPLDVPSFSTRCLLVQWRERPLAAESGTLRWREMFRQILSRIRLPPNSRDLSHAANLRHGTDGYISSPKKGVLRISSLKNPTVSAWFETGKLGTKSQHATSRPPNPIYIYIYTRIIYLSIPLPSYLSIHQSNYPFIPQPISPLYIKAQISHHYKTADKIMFMHVRIFLLLDSGLGSRNAVHGKVADDYSVPSARYIFKIAVLMY